MPSWAGGRGPLCKQRSPSSMEGREVATSPPLVAPEVQQGVTSTLKVRLPRS